jgi:hypothetical protein
MKLLLASRSPRSWQGSRFASFVLEQHYGRWDIEAQASKQTRVLRLFTVILIDAGFSCRVLWCCSRLAANVCVMSFHRQGAMLEAILMLSIA